MLRELAAALAAALVILPCRAAAPTEDACTAFTWDVAHERSLFGAAPQLLAAGKTSAAAPALSLDRLYELQLAAQSEVTGALPPAKQRDAAGGYAGLAGLTLMSAGVYRIALDGSTWVDVIANGASIASRGHQGRTGCHAPHKVVEFVLAAGVPLTLQFSSAAATVRVTVTRAPRQTP